MKIKKSLMLSVLTLVTTVVTLTPAFTMSACGNKLTSADTTTKPDQPSTPGGTDTPSQPEIINSGLNKGLPINWTQADLEKAVNEYPFFIKNKTDAELIQELDNLMQQLSDANTTAYDGLGNIVSYEELSLDQVSGTWIGGYSLKSGKTFDDVYNFFVNKTSKNIFPTWEKITNSVPSGTNQSSPDQPEKPDQTLNEKIFALMYVYRYIVTEYTYMKMCKIVEKLSQTKTLEIKDNIIQIATALDIIDTDMVWFFNAKNPEFDAMNPSWGNQFAWQTTHAFSIIYDNIPFEIDNPDLHIHIDNIDTIELNYQTGLLLLTFIAKSNLTTIKNKDPHQPTEDTLPQNYTEVQYESAINDYSNKVEAMSLTNILDAMNHINGQLQDWNTSAYTGLSSIATYSLPTPDPEDPSKITGGLKFNKGKTIQDVYHFFASQVSNQLFPTEQNFNDYINALPESEFPENKNELLFSAYMVFYAFNKSLFSINKLLLLDTNLLDVMTSATKEQKTTIQNFAYGLQYWQFLYNGTKTYIDAMININSSITKLYNFIAPTINIFLNKCNTLGLVLKKIDITEVDPSDPKVMEEVKKQMMVQDNSMAYLFYLPALPPNI